MSLLPARMKKIQFKMKSLECSQHVSHYKSKRIFQTCKGSLLRSQWSDLAEFDDSTVSSILSGLDTRSLGHIRHNVVSSLVTVSPLECSQHVSHYSLRGFSRRARAAYSAVSGLIWPNLMIVQFHPYCQVLRLGPFDTLGTT